MTDMKPSHYIVGIILFTFAIMGVLGLMTAFDQQDENFLDDEEYYAFNTTFNKYDNLNSNIDELQGRLSSDTEEGTFGVLNSLIKIGWNSLTTLLTSFSFMEDVFNGMTTFFGVPYWIPALIIMLITTLIIFAIFGAIFQKDV